MAEKKVVLENFEDIKQKIKQEAKDSADLLHLVWKDMFGLDTRDPDAPDESIKPWEYGMSSALAEELIEYSIDAFKEDRGGVGFLWLNFSPSCKEGLAENEIMVGISDGE